MTMALRTLSVLLFFAFCGQAIAEVSIGWRVKHPFRFFTDTTDFDMHREAFADVLAANGNVMPDTMVSDLERLINDPRWLDQWYAANPGKYPEPDGAGRPERGWAHHIDRRNATCWDSRAQWHSTCKSDTYGQTLRTDYVLPQRHTVIFRLGEPPAGDCTWTAPRAIFKVGTSSLTRERTIACNVEPEARIPFEPEKPEAERGVAVSVTLPDGSMVEHTPVWVRDRLIVGIGDSYSSGEGNPDTPVELDRRPLSSNGTPPFVYDPGEQAIRRVTGRSVAVRGRNAGPANWNDRKCHRSLYSYHLRTALQVALADPEHSAVTFLGYACSGSEVTEGLLLPYIGKEHVSNRHFTAAGAVRKDWSQVDRVIAELCSTDVTAQSPQARRQIDLDEPITADGGERLTRISTLYCPGFLRDIDMLVISIGGNDVGFVPLIIEVIAKNGPPLTGGSTIVGSILQARGLLRRLMHSVAGYNVAQATGKAEELLPRFAALRKALEPLPISEKAGKKNVVLTAFPPIENNQNGDLCGETSPRERMEGLNFGGFLAVDVPTLRQVEGFADNVLYPKLRLAAGNDWHFVDEHRAAFENHGFCAQDRSGGVRPPEDLMLPYFKNASPHDEWVEFNPVTRTRAYAPRQRWVRTMNDACLFVQFKRKGTPLPRHLWGLLDLVEACLGGPFHPTAEGHAHVGNAVYRAAETILGLAAPTSEILRPD